MTPQSALALASAILVPACAVAPGPNPNPSPELLAFLADCELNYDSERHMLRCRWSGPDYHTNVSAGTWVHPTRPSLDYAIALLDRGQPVDVARAANLIAKVISLQETDETHDYYGVWPWLLEEPLVAMDPPDRNWAEFCGARLAQILVDHSSRLRPRLIESMRTSLRHAAWAIRTRDVDPGYTNIAIMGAAVTAAAGELLDDVELLAFARAKLRAVVDDATEHGNFREYNSPTYTTIALLECERVLHTVDDGVVRTDAETLRRIAWRTIAASFHQPTAQWAGPHSRAYTDRLAMWQVAALNRRLALDHVFPVHPAADLTPPGTYESDTALPCPESLRSRFLTAPIDPVSHRRAFGNDRIGTTWMDTVACLGTINRACFWAQRRPLLAYWRTTEDPAVVLRLRVLHDGEDFAAIGVQTVQDAMQALSVFYLLGDRGDHHRHLDRPKEGVYMAHDIRVRFELRGRGATARDLGEGMFELSAGSYRARIDTRPGRFFDGPVTWSMGRAQAEEGNVERRVYVDAVLHHGPQKRFDFRRSGAIELAVAIQLLPGDEPSQPRDLQVTGSEATKSVTATWGTLRCTAPTVVRDSDS